MFTAVDEYTARSRSGVEVSLSREFVAYQRDDRWAHFAYEYLIFEDAILVYSSAIRCWDAAHGGAIIRSQERDAIIQDLRDAFDVLGIKYRFEV